MIVTIEQCGVWLKMLAVFLLVSVAGRAQQTAKDSLEDLIHRRPEHDTVRFRFLISMSDVLLSDPAESKRYLDEANSLAKELNYEDGIAESYCSLANYYWNRSEFATAIEHGLLALRRYETTKDPRGLYESYNTLAGIHSSIEEFEKAAEYMEKILALAKSGKIEVDYGELYYNMTWLMLKSGRNEQGLALINQSLEYFIKKGNSLELGMVFFLRAKALQALHRFPPALDDLRRCIATNKSLGNPTGNVSIAAAHETMGDIYKRLSKFQLAALHLDTALIISKEIGSPNLVIKIYGHLVDLSEAKRDYKQAFEYQQLRRDLEDSIFNTEKSRQLAEVETRYETEKKEQTIQILERDRKIQGLWRNILLSGLLFVMLVSASVIVWLRDREKRNRRLFGLQIDYLTSRHESLSKKYHEPVSAAGPATLVSQDQRFLKKALEVIENHLSDPLFGVEKMASEMAMTRASLHRKLKTLTGASPSDFIRTIRLKRAATMLTNKVDSVSQIAFAVGFDDQSYFSKAFKRQFGVSPSVYASNPKDPD